jgi:hypothetical protein
VHGNDLHRELRVENGDRFVDGLPISFRTRIGNTDKLEKKARPRAHEKSLFEFADDRDFAERALFGVLME